MDTLEALQYELVSEKYELSRLRAAVSQHQPLTQDQRSEWIRLTSAGRPMQAPVEADTNSNWKAVPGLQLMIFASAAHDVCERCL